MVHLWLAKGNKKRTVTIIKKQLNKIEDEVGMAVPKSTQTRFNFVGITYHIHYTSLRYTDYPWMSHMHRVNIV